MRLVFLLAAPLFFAFNVHAADIAIEGGFRQQSASTDATGVSIKAQTGYQLGATALFPINETLAFRTGFFYTQRPVQLQDDILTGSAKVSMSYFDIPAALAYRFEGYAHIFLGTALAMRLDSSVSGDGTYSTYKVKEDKDMLTPIILGASFKFAPEVGLTVYYEANSGDVFKDVHGYRAVGLNLVFTID